VIADFLAEDILDPFLVEGFEDRLALAEWNGDLDEAHARSIVISPERRSCLSKPSVRGGQCELLSESVVVQQQ
jgi:hypothetical protein